MQSGYSMDYIGALYGELLGHYNGELEGAECRSDGTYDANRLIRTLWLL